MSLLGQKGADLGLKGNTTEGAKMVTVHISETYDLHSKVGKMTLIGIHTPTKDLIKRTYPGLAVNHKFFHIDHVSVRLAAVSTLPISPDQVGLDTGDIAPEDMLNPILYKAVTNESWSTIEARLNGLRNDSANSIGNMLDYSPDNVTGLSDDFNVYYSLLANRTGFKIAHPQQGLSMNKLVPLVFDRYYSHGQNQHTFVDMEETEGYVLDDTLDGNTIAMQSSGPVPSTAPMYSIRGKPHKLPRMNTTYITSVKGSAGVIGQNTAVGFEANTNPYPRTAQADMMDCPPLYCGMVIMPPARRTIMFYRLVCTAQITFSGVRPIQDVANFQSLSERYGPYVYHSDYSTQSKAMSKTTDLVDVDGAEIVKIMEG